MKANGKIIIEYRIKFIGAYFYDLHLLNNL